MLAGLSSYSRSRRGHVDFFISSVVFFHSPCSHLLVTGDVEMHDHFFLETRLDYAHASAGTLLFFLLVVFRNHASHSVFYSFTRAAPLDNAERQEEKDLHSSPTRQRIRSMGICRQSLDFYFRRVMMS